MNNRNALAELAENLEHDNFFGCDHFDREVWVGKAQRIVEELAKVNAEDVYGNRTFYLIASSDAVEKCRAIAEGGAGDA